MTSVMRMKALGRGRIKTQYPIHQLNGKCHVGECAKSREESLQWTNGKVSNSPCIEGCHMWRKNAPCMRRIACQDTCPSELEDAPHKGELGGVNSKLEIGANF